MSWYTKLPVPDDLKATHDETFLNVQDHFFSFERLSVEIRTEIRLDGI
jgi:hypothetical protein